MKGKVLALRISILLTLSLCMPYLPIYAEGVRSIEGIPPVANGGYIYVGGIRWRVLGVKDSA